MKVETNKFIDYLHQVRIGMHTAYINRDMN